VAVQVHWMRHAGLIGEDEFRALTLFDLDQRDVGPGLVIERPYVIRHVAVQGDLEHTSDGFGSKREKNRSSTAFQR
jgi:hypothetical protein